MSQPFSSARLSMYPRFYLRPALRRWIVLFTQVVLSFILSCTRCYCCKWAYRRRISYATSSAHFFGLLRIEVKVCNSILTFHHLALPLSLMSCSLLVLLGQLLHCGHDVLSVLLICDLFFSTDSSPVRRCVNSPNFFLLPALSFRSAVNSSKLSAKEAFSVVHAACKTAFFFGSNCMNSQSSLDWPSFSMRPKSWVSGASFLICPFGSATTFFIPSPAV